MTPQEINAAIAESLGWKYLENIITPSRSFNGAQSMGDCWQRPDGNCGYGDYVPPNYCNDLNAMHEVIKSLDVGTRFKWFGMLYLVCTETPFWEDDTSTERCAHSVCNATALQRAEAYLKTIGKWND